MSSPTTGTEVGKELEYLRAKNDALQAEVEKLRTREGTLREIEKKLTERLARAEGEVDRLREKHREWVKRLREIAETKT